MINQKEKAISQFFTYLSVKVNSNINRNLINPFVDKFFKEKGVKNYLSIQENAEISDLDFKKVEFSYFYDYVFNDINKHNDIVEIIVKYCITVDKKNCSKKCDITGILYDEILLYNQPIFYFIYVDIEEILTFIREQN